MDLRGVRILVTRPRDQAGAMARLIEEAGGIALCIPMIRILPPESWEECDHAIERLHDFTGVVFTSVNAVKRFLHRMAEKHCSAARLAGKSVYAIGDPTARFLQSHGVQPLPALSTFSGRGLAAQLRNQEFAGKKILLPRGSLGRDEVAEALREAGAVVVPVVVYRTVGPDSESVAFVRTAMASRSVDVVAFASPSAVEHFVRALDAEHLEAARSGLMVAAIGETTAAAVRLAGLREPVIARTATSEGLVEALVMCEQTL